jgi:diaminohydroxyphosphoribosylaminopyrimidine deaminase/5-amino-6-(5-phosphoribosylamino)uracil reductase
MRLALSAATRGWGQTAPNPLVGAVVFAGDDLAGEGYHARFGERHAEVVALEQAGDRARGATLYVTLEPCNHHGKTPPCVDSIIDAGVSRVVIAARDPNPLASGGVDKLRDAGIAVELGVLESDAHEMNAPFFNSFKSERPWVTLKLAVSLDGAIAAADRKPRWLTGEESRILVHRMRAANDAVAVGIATATADDPELTARTDPAPRVPPLRIVFDRSARLSSESKLAKTASIVPTLLVTSSATQLPADLARQGVEAIPAHNVGDALLQLRSRGITSLMVEGGAGLAASFMAGGFVDRLVIFQAPLVLGAGSLNAFSGIAGHDVDSAPRFRVVSSRQIGDDIMTVYSVEKS